jgi:hypothetical protein
MVNILEISEEIQRKIPYPYFVESNQVRAVEFSKMEKKTMVDGTTRDLYTFIFFDGRPPKELIGGSFVFCTEFKNGKEKFYTMN